MEFVSLKVRVCRLLSTILLFAISLSFIGCSNSKSINIITKIDSLEWRAIAEIEEWKSCDESDWEVPEGAIVYKEQEEIKSYKTVGYETKYRIEEYQEKIGYYLPTWRPRYETRTRKVPYEVVIKEPVYATKYYYNINRWVHLKNVLLASGHDANYNHPDYVCGENERVQNIEYEYWVNFGCEEKYISQTVDRDIWENLKVGQELFGVKNQCGIIYIDWERSLNNG